MGRCGVPERTESTDLIAASMTLRHILMNIIIEGLVVLKELIFNFFYFGQVWWS